MDKQRPSTRVNSKVSDLSKLELIQTSCRSESSNISLVVLDIESKWLLITCQHAIPLSLPVMKGPGTAPPVIKLVLYRGIYYVLQSPTQSIEQINL